nr:hypothetical protein [Tanacetum cinerariifolium]
MTRWTFLSGKEIVEIVDEEIIGEENVNDDVLNESKPVEKTTHVSLVLDFTSGPSSGVRAGPSRGRQDPPNPGLVCMRTVLTKNRRCVFFLAYSLLFSFLLLFSYPPFESFVMLLEESDDLNIPGAAPIEPVLEPSSLPKFDMHLYQSSLTMSHVRYLVKLYGIPEELHSLIASAGMTMNALSPGAIGLYVHHFQQGGLRVPFSSFFLKVVEHFCVHISQLAPLGVNHVIFFEMYCRSLDITPIVPLFRVFYKLCKQSNWFSFQNRAGMDCKPYLKDALTSLKKWKDKFFLVDRRAATIVMAWRHHDSSVANPFPRHSEYNTLDHAGRTFSIKVSKGKGNILVLSVVYLSTYLSIYSLFFVVITMAEFLRLPNFKGCKVTAGSLLLPGTARVTHLAPPAGRLEDIPSKTADMVVAEILCQKVLDDKEKKKRKTEGKIVAQAPAANIQAEATVNKAARREGPRKKRQVEPLEALANEEHASPPLSFGSMNTLKDQTDEHAAPPRVFFASKPVVDKGVQDNVDASHAVEGHGDNEDGLSELQTHPSPAQPSGYYARRFGNLPFTPQWGLTDSSRMDNSRECQDMMANLFTPADEEFLTRVSEMSQPSDALGNYYVNVKVHYKECKKELTMVQLANDEKVSTLDQLSKNYDGALTQEKGLQDRLEELEEEKKEADQLNSSHANWIKQLEEALKQSEAGAQQLRVEKKRYAIEAAKDEMSLSDYQYSFESMIVGRLFLAFVELTNSICYLVIFTTSVGIRARFLIKMFPRRSEGEELEYPVFQGDGLSFNEWRDYDVAGDDYEGPPIFDDDQFKDELEIRDDSFMLIGKKVATNSEIPEAIIPLLEEFSNVFHDELPDALSPLCDIQHHIDLEPSSQLPNRPHYRFTCAQPLGPLDLMSLHVSDSVPKKVQDFVEGFPYHGDSSVDDLVGNSRTNFVYPWGNDAGPSVKEGFLLFLEAQDRVKKKSLFKVS